MSSPDITSARAATAEIEQLLQPAIEELRGALNVTEQSGVYADAGAVRTAMVRAKSAIDQALRLARQVNWPLSPTARLQIVRAGVAQVERRGFLPGDGGIKTPSRSTPSDEPAS